MSKPSFSAWTTRARAQAAALGMLQRPADFDEMLAERWGPPCPRSRDEVLDPTGRKEIWRRVSTPKADEQNGRVMGLSTDLANFDMEKVGWKYEALECGDGSTPILDCNPGDTDETLTLGPLFSIGLARNFLNVPPYTAPQIEDRKVYNTNYYSQSNTGHEFTSVLTDHERRAIIEYLKTL